MVLLQFDPPGDGRATADWLLAADRLAERLNHEADGGPSWDGQRGPYLHGIALLGSPEPILMTSHASVQMERGVWGRLSLSRLLGPAPFMERELFSGEFDLMLLVGGARFVLQARAVWRNMIIDAGETPMRFIESSIFNVRRAARSLTPVRSQSPFQRLLRLRGLR